MATAPLPDPAGQALRWIADYRARGIRGDVLAETQAAAWATMFEELALAAGDDLAHARERVARQAVDIGMGFRLIGDAEERPWPLSPVPLMVAEREWDRIARCAVQRARLLELVIEDPYAAARLVERGLVPAALVTGSPRFLRR